MSYPAFMFFSIPFKRFFGKGLKSKEHKKDDSLDVPLDTPSPESTQYVKVRLTIKQSPNQVNKNDWRSL